MRYLVVETKIYNKLVRDKIPEIIKASGASCQCEVLQDEKYAAALAEKLKEEVAEFLQEFDAENDEEAIKELADIQEVILAIVDLIGVEREKFELIRQSKVKTNGEFKKQIMLKSVSKQ